MNLYNIQPNDFEMDQTYFKFATEAMACAIYTVCPV